MTTSRQTSGRRQATRRVEMKPRDRNTKLIEARFSLGLSRADLARRTAVSSESIRLAELGFVPGPRIQFAIADALNTEVLALWPIERQRVAA